MIKIIKSILSCTNLKKKINKKQKVNMYETKLRLEISKYNLLAVIFLVISKNSITDNTPNTIKV